MHHRSVLIAIVIAIGLLPALAQMPVAEAAECGNTYIEGHVPLTDLGASTYRGEQGGLYPGGSNEVPASHLDLGQKIAGGITPLDGEGRPSATGRIVLVSIGVSNTGIEFNDFMTAMAAHSDVSPNVIAVNGSQGGAPISSWTDPNAPTWGNVEERVRQAGLTAAQVQAAWVKLPERNPTEPFPADADTYSEDLSEVLRNLKIHFPNTLVAYQSSRIYAGYGTQLSPEPWAYQHGFGVKWTIQDQIEGVDGLNSDPGTGPVQAPWVAWGPYMWANGLGPDRVEGGEPGRSDGVEWLCSDFRLDGIHPSSAGAAKVATMLLDHFLTHPTACAWFLTEAAREETGCDVVVSQPEETMHVADISVALEAGTSGTTATASIRILDEEARAVVDATVTGDWFRDGVLFQSGRSESTDSTGRAVITSVPFTPDERDLITFCVSEVAHSSFSHDPADDVEECDRARAG